MPASITPLLVELALCIFLVKQVLFVPIHETVIIFASLSDLIGKLTMFVGNIYLLLKSDLFIIQLAKAVLEHVSLNLLLLHLHSLLELARALQTRGLIHLLG